MAENNQAYTTKLIDQLCKGQRKAQYELYKNYIGMVFHTAYRITANKADAEDVVQESFVKVFEKIKSFKQQSSLGWWIKRIVVHTALNKIEKKKKMPLESIDEQSKMFQLSTQENEKSGYMRNGISMKEIQTAVLSLPDGCRMVFNLYAFEGYTHDEIAGILKISNSTSKTQYRRARLLLQPILNSKING